MVSPAEVADFARSRKSSAEQKQASTSAPIDYLDNFNKVGRRHVLGCFQTHIVGVVHYKPKPVDGQLVFFARDPNNEYDKHAIQAVRACGRTVIGHLPREEAQVLALRLDHDRISMFGIVRDSSIVAREVPAVENAWRSGIAIDVIITSKLQKQVRQQVCDRMETACKSLALYRDTKLEDSMRMKLLELLQIKSSNQATRLAARVKQLEDEKQHSEARSQRLQDQINDLQTQIKEIVNLN